VALTVVMYHYVRCSAESRYPAIRGLERDSFTEQLKYIRRFYTPITGQQLVDAVKGRRVLPSNSILLTFDDGYIDHFVTVFPILQREKISAVFFPPARCILENVVLDVNKIHFVLASVPDTKAIVDIIDASVREATGKYALEPLDDYKRKYAVASRFDTSDVIYVKRMLQVALPATLRASIVSDLFSRYVTSDEGTFAREIYMNADQIRQLVEAGMTVGSHGYNHEWLDRLTPAEQARDIDKSMEFLRGVGVRLSEWSMCYPYGGWSESLLGLLRERDCAVGFTTKTAVVGIGECDPLLLPRLDTNDLPKSASAEPVAWTRAINA
jgi:peptidoglycan/xylan/chitin deacetylase (PgdA/CDA1 family)